MAIEITYRGSCVGTHGIMKTARMAIAGSWSDAIVTYDDIQGILVMSDTKAQIVYKAIKRRLVRIFRLKIVLLKMIGQIKANIQNRLIVSSDRIDRRVL